MRSNAGTFERKGDWRLDAVRLALFMNDVGFQAHENSLDRHLGMKGGMELTEPQAMLRYAGRVTGSYPGESPVATLQVDEILHILSEIEAEMELVDGSSELREELVAVIIPHYASLIEKRLARLRDIEDKLLIHEIALYCWLKSAQEMGFKADLETLKCISAVVSKAENHPKVKDWTALHRCNGYPHLKLTYFPFPGRAEPIRLALFMGGIAFEDERIGVDELSRRRSSLPFNQLPVLEVDGELVSQALAILRYVGTLSGLYSPSNIMEVLRIDELFSLIDEFYSSYTWNASYFERDPTKQLHLRMILAEKTLPRTLGFLEKRVSQWNGLHCVGDALTVADLAVYALLWTFQSSRIAGVPVTVVAPYENLLRVYQTVSNHPKVVEWTAMTH